MDLINIKGVGEKTLKLLNKLEIYTVNDLIEYYPYRYDNYERTNITDDNRIVIDGIVESVPNSYHFNRRMDKMSFKLNIGTNLVNIVIFNRSFLKNKILVGNTITIVGKYDKKNNTIVASDIKFSSLDNLPKYSPVYHTVHGLTSNMINNYINEALKYVNNITDNIPNELMLKYNFLDKLKAINIIHNPTNKEELKQAIVRLKYEELYTFMHKINTLKDKRNYETGLTREVDFNLIVSFINDLPFTLTKDQLTSVNDIYNDLISSKRMNRLLQGDVGSGKTIVSFIALFINYLSGYQGALMAPTEILATQHFNNFNKLFSKYNIKVALLTGKIKSKEKKTLLEDIKNNKYDIIIGTHALISDNVIYNNLGLIITDEQHRFGVNQREILKNKGRTPDILYMSATPIPRTYALTLYGDMDISSITIIPSGRKEVITLLKNSKEIKEVLTLMYNELKNKHQIYVISPLIEDENDSNLVNINELNENINKAFGKVCNIEVLHGKLKNVEKESVMERFKNNETQILISTTVIEVGVDVSNATMIVIFDSFRFGLAQLHQLRGRVGRNSLQSYCVLISDKDTERLDVMVNTTDGFKISEEDFKLRGSGDLFGIRQSGEMNFKLANIKKDYNMLLQIKKDIELKDTIN